MTTNSDVRKFLNFGSKSVYGKKYSKLNITQARNIRKMGLKAIDDENERLEKKISKSKGLGLFKL